MWTLNSSLPYAAGRFSNVAVSSPASRTPRAMIHRAASWPGPGDCSPRYFALSVPKYGPHPVRIRSESPRWTSTPCAFIVSSRWRAVISNPGGSPKISWVIRCVRLSANAYGGFRPRIGDCSFQVNDRSNRRAPLTARTNSSGDGRVCAAAGPAMATVPATLAAAVSHSRRDTVPIRSSLASGFANPAPGGRPTDTRSRHRTQPPTTAHAPSPLAWRAAPRLCCTPGRRGHGADGESDDDRSDPSLLRRPRRGRRSRRAARHGDVPADLRRLPGVFRARLQRTAAHRRDADGVQPALRSARDDHQRDRARESPPPEPRQPPDHGSEARGRPHGLDRPAHALPAGQPARPHGHLVQAGAGDGVAALRP